MDLYWGCVVIALAYLLIGPKNGGNGYSGAA